MAFTVTQLEKLNQELIESTKRTIKSVLAKAPSDPVEIKDPNVKDKNGNPITVGFEPIKMVEKLIKLDEPNALWNLKEPSENVEKLLVPFNLEVVVQMLNLYEEFNSRIEVLEARLMDAIATLQTNVNSQISQQNANVNSQLQQQQQQNNANNADVNSQLNAINSTLGNINTSINTINGKIIALENKIK